MWHATFCHNDYSSFVVFHTLFCIGGGFCRNMPLLSRKRAGRPSVLCLTYTVSIQFVAGFQRLKPEGFGNGLALLTSCNPYFLACFFSQNSVFFSWQISRVFSAKLTGQWDLIFHRKQCHDSNRTAPVSVVSCVVIWDEQQIKWWALYHRTVGVLLY